MTFDLTKPVETKSGIKLRVLCTDAPGKYPVICIDDGGVAYRYTPGGTYFSKGSSCLDLINSPEMVEIDVWVNVYKLKDSATTFGHPYTTKELAIKSKTSGYVCTLHIQRTVPVGHVDE